MVRSSDDWRKAGESKVEGTLDDLEDTLDDLPTPIRMTTASFRHRALEREEPDQRVLRDLSRNLEELLVDAAHDLLDAAYEVRGLRTGATFRNLRGKEPLGYSKRDGGVTTDAFYGTKAQGRQMARCIKWPLRLDEWDKEVGHRTRDGRTPVTAKGVEKYTTKVGGRKVTLVFGERPPPI